MIDEPTITCEHIAEINNWCKRKRYSVLNPMLAQIFKSYPLSHHKINRLINCGLTTAEIASVMTQILKPSCSFTFILNISEEIKNGRG